MRDPVKVSALVVLYRCRVLESSTLAWLLASEERNDLDVLVWDNSPQACAPDDLELLASRGVEYVHCSENASLARVYNHALERFADSDMLVLLDQDSRLEAGYFAEVRSVAAGLPEVALLVPRVRSASNGVLVSPGRAGILQGRKWNDPETGVHASRGILALGSGLAMRPQALIGSGPRFDEALSLYCIDTKFMMDFPRFHDSLYVMATTIEHGDSSEEVEDVEVKLRRFRNYIRGYRHAFASWNGSPSLTWIYSIGLGLKNSVRYRTFRFLFAALALSEHPRKREP